jgi:hypothetical protein
MRAGGFPGRWRQSGNPLRGPRAAVTDLRSQRLLFKDGAQGMPPLEMERRWESPMRIPASATRAAGLANAPAGEGPGEKDQMLERTKWGSGQIARPRLSSKQSATLKHLAASSPFRKAQRIATVVVGTAVLLVGVALVVLPGPSPLAQLPTRAAIPQSRFHRLVKAARPRLQKPGGIQSSTKAPFA